MHLRPDDVFHAVDGIVTDFYERNGNQIIPRKLIHGLRVRSMEEMYQFYANILAFFALVVAVVSVLLFR